jgi:hypothetical protein
MSLTTPQQGAHMREPRFLSTNIFQCTYYQDKGNVIFLLWNDGAAFGHGPDCVTGVG